MRPEIVLVSLWLWLSALFAPNADAAATFTDRAAWDLTVSGVTAPYYEDFATFTQDTYFRTQPVQCSFFTLERQGADTNANYISASLGLARMWTNTGLTAGTPTSVEMAFDAPLSAWGADFVGAATGDLLNLELYGNAGTLVETVPVTINTGFFGFTTSAAAPVASVVFRSRTNASAGNYAEYFTMDNVSGGDVHTPELPPGALLAIGMLPVALAWWRRRKQD